MGTFAQKAIGLLDGAAEAAVYSSVHEPLEALSFLRRSLLFAELSNLAYLSRAEAGRFAYRIGFPEIRYYDQDGAQAYVFANSNDAVVTCRGTEAREWNDVRADLDVATTVSETVGWVHRGFKREVDDLWPRLERTLINNRRTLWFTGHSLGGAMAAICAGRCKLSYIRSNPRGLYTFGSPRIGCRRYVNYVQLEAYRWVNNNDIVSRLPPRWLGFRHLGKEIYLNADGRICKYTTWQRIKDRCRGIIGSLRVQKFDHFFDHSIGQYIKHLRTAVEEAENEIIPIRSSLECAEESFLAAA